MQFINLLFLLSALCPNLELINYTEFWGAEDYSWAYEHRDACNDGTDKFPCTLAIIKKRAGYSILCGPTIYDSTHMHEVDGGKEK